MLQVRSFLARAHLLFALVPLVFLAAAGTHAAHHGFFPTPRTYPLPELDPVAVTDQIKNSFPQGLSDKVIAVWGVGEGALEAGSPALETLERLSRLGARLRIDASWMTGPERKLLPGGAVQAGGPLAAVRGSEALLILGARPEYHHIDFSKVAPLMVRRLIFDARDWLDTGAPGMDLFPDYILATRPTWPPWLDPELLLFVQELRERVPENQSFLLAPRNFHTFNPRGRWFLELNYFLFPRPLFLAHSIQASGTVGQFQAWIQDTLKRKTAVGRGLQERNVNWLLTYDQWTDFRAKDWKLQSRGGLGR